MSNFQNNLQTHELYKTTAVSPSGLKAAVEKIKLFVVVEAMRTESGVINLEKCPRA